MDNVKFSALGLVKEIGLSNYHASEVERALDLCASNGWASPSVYQGLYNPLNRRVEAELLPLLAKRGVRFVAFNALAAGEWWCWWWSWWWCCCCCCCCYF